MPRTSESGTKALAEIECARRGWVLRHTSYWQHVKRDLLGMFDGLAFDERSRKVYAIQWTSEAHATERAAKIAANQDNRLVRMCGWTILVWGFDLANGTLAKELRAEPV